MPNLELQQGEKVYARGRNGYFKPIGLDVMDYDPEKKALVVWSRRGGNDFPIVLSILREDAIKLGQELIK